MPLLEAMTSRYGHAPAKRAARTESSLNAVPLAAACNNESGSGPPQYPRALGG